MTAQNYRTVFIIGIEFDFSKEPRIIQEIQALKGTCKLIGAGRGGHPDMDEFINIRENRSLTDKCLDVLLKVLKYFLPPLIRFRHREVLRQIDRVRPDCITAHHLESAILAYSRTDKMLFNSHEFIPRQNDGSMLWRLTKGWLIKQTLPKTLKNSAVMFVEGEAVKEAYERQFTRLPEIVVLPNATQARPDLKPVPVDKNEIRLVHHGLASGGRGLEMLIDAVKLLGPGYSLSFYLVKSAIFPAHLQKLKEYAGGADNIHFYDPVPYEKIVPVMNQYDIGLCMFRSSNYHTLYTTVPNKFWEYIAARVCPVVWKKSAMARILERNDLGFIAEENSPEGIANVLRGRDAASLDEQKRRLDERHNSFSSESVIYPVVREWVNKSNVSFLKP